MPVDIGAVGAAGVYQLPPGTYVRLLRKRCEIRCEIEYVEGNPKCSVLVDDWRAALVESAKAEKLAAGEPIVVMQGLVRQGRPMPGMPVWLAASVLHVAASQVRVYPDDVCEPTAFRGGRLPNGGFEQIPVQPRHHHHAC